MRSFVVCGWDAGWPNVRAAARAEEMTAVEQRFRDEVSRSGREGYRGVIEDFRLAVCTSEAVFCKPLAKVLALVSSDNELYTSYYNLVEAGARLPEKNIYDTGRAAVDSTLFPNYHKEIQFASLTLDGRDPKYYGDCSIVLKEVAIRDRATVFEENSFEFFQKHAITAGSKAPVGYRTTWNNRDRLAVAKLGKWLNKESKSDSFPKILLNDVGKSVDFIEVHIFGPIPSPCNTLSDSKQSKEKGRSSSSKIRTE